MLLYEGRQIFYDPVSSASDYFTGLGFIRPAQATTSDFLTSLTSQAERIVRAGYEGRVPRSPDDFARVWKASQEATLVDSQIENFNDAYPIYS